MIASTATPPTIMPILAGLRPGNLASQVPVASGRSSAKARNCAVLAERSGAARNSPVVMRRPLPCWSSGRSVMAKTVADGPDPNRHSADIRDKRAELPRLGSRIGRQHVRTMHESRQDNYAACPDDERLSPDPLDHLLEMADVGGPDMQQRVRLTGDCARIDDLRVRRHCGPDFGG